MYLIENAKTFGFIDNYTNLMKKKGNKIGSHIVASVTKRVKETEWMTRLQLRGNDSIFTHFLFRYYTKSIIVHYDTSAGIVHYDTSAGK